MSDHLVIRSSAERFSHTCTTREDTETVHTYQQQPLLCMSTGDVKEGASRRLVTEAAVRALTTFASRHNLAGTSDYALQVTHLLSATWLKVTKAAQVTFNHVADDR